MLSLHTNNAALSAQNAISRTQNNLSTSMTRLSTGYRINSAMDDAAGLQIATRLKAQSSGMAVAMRNTQNATSMMQTAEGALGEASNILVRMKDLATQAADASSSSKDKSAMQSEYDALASELTNIIGNTSFGGAKLLTGLATQDDVDNAVERFDDAALALTDAEGRLGAVATTPGDATNAPIGGTGAIGDLETAQWDYDHSADAAAKAINFQVLINAKTNLDKVTADVAKAQTEEINATNYRATVEAAVLSKVTGTLNGELSFQIGASSSETMKLDMSGDVTKMHDALKAVSAQYNAYGAATTITADELTADGKANLTVDKLQTALDALGAVRSSMGAAGNRLEHANTNLANVSANTQSAAGRIMDVDFATESAAMTSSQMLLQAGTAMLKQSNSMSSMVMSLLQ